MSIAQDLTPQQRKVSHELVAKAILYYEESDEAD